MAEFDESLNSVRIKSFKLMDYKMGEIYMIGVHHRDSDVARKLEEVFDRVHPDLILNETSADFVEFERLNRECMAMVFASKNVSPVVVSSLLEKAALLGHELEASQSYATRCGIEQDFLNDQGRPLDEELIDYQKQCSDLADILTINPGFVNARFEAVVESVNSSLMNVSQFVIPNLGTPKEEEIFKLLDSDIADPAMNWERDAKMEATLRQARERLGDDANIVTVTGLAHLIRTKVLHTFYSRVLDLNPKRVFLLGSIVYEGETS